LHNSIPSARARFHAFNVNNDRHDLASFANKLRFPLQQFGHPVRPDPELHFYSRLRCDLIPNGRPENVSPRLNFKGPTRTPSQIRTFDRTDASTIESFVLDWIETIALHGATMTLSPIDLEDGRDLLRTTQHNAAQRMTIDTDTRAFDTIFETTSKRYP